MKKNKTKSNPINTNTRKATRKQKRLQKKIHRQEHYMKKKNPKELTKYIPGQFVSRPDVSPESDKVVKKKQKKVSLTPHDVLSKERQKDIKETKKLKSEMEKQRMDIFLKANEDEEKIIKKLEKQLGLNKCKNRKNFFANDGLDYLLEICDRATSEQIVAAEKHLADVDGESDFEEDLAVVTGKETTRRKSKQKIDQEDIDSDINDNGDSEDLSDAEHDSDEGDKEDESDEEFETEGSGDETGDDDGESTKSIVDSQDSKDEPEVMHSKSKKAKLSDKISKPKQIKENEFDTNKKTVKKERIVKADELNKVFSDDEVSHLSDYDDDMEGFSNDDMQDEVEEVKEKPDEWEDIYGRKRDKEGNIIREEKGTYVPPHLRNKDSTSEKDLIQLKRQIKSVLNKLAGTNLHWASTSIENLYSNNSRNAVNTSLTQLWLEATVGPAATPDRMVAEHAALVSVLHANVATEIGAHFLQELTTRFDEMMLKPQPVEDKRLDNLVSCLAHLYSFKIYHASLLYDIFARLMEELTEKNIECVLVALRSVGGVLRKEEPLALRTFIHQTQAKVAAASEGAASGSRIKFLLEVLMAVKNNNLTKIPNYDPSYAEELKKQTRSIIRKGNYITPLNIRLEDLLKAEERGKWWIVGSAWEGSAKPELPKETKVLHADHKLLELARAQRMNTDVRRTIFCVIMAAEDYMDAFEKLQHLGLRGQQEREVVHVLMACCLQEARYNPFYAVLAQKLCETDRKYQLSIQYSTWDKIKVLENLPKHSSTNLAQFLVHLIMAKGLPLSVLKVIQFSDLNKHTVRFMRQILLAILTHDDLQACLEVFQRVSRPPKLKMFRESVRLFVQHFVVKRASRAPASASAPDPAAAATLAERASQVERILTMHESKLQF